MLDGHSCLRHNRAETWWLEKRILEMVWYGIPLSPYLKVYSKAPVILLSETDYVPTRLPALTWPTDRDYKHQTLVVYSEFMRNKVWPGSVNGPVTPLSTVEALRKFQQWKNGNYKTGVRINALWWNLTASSDRLTSRVVSYARTPLWNNSSPLCRIRSAHFPNVNWWIQFM